MKDRIALLLAALWWGSLTTIGFLVVPMLFARLGNPAVAGNFAGQLFAAQTWIALGCGLVLLVHFRAQGGGESVSAPARKAISLIVIALLLALLQQYAVAPHILARENLRLWHTVGSGMYLAQWICAGVLLWRMH
ncbi:DUF4149 domain-containing protein [Variovorax sp. J22P168]|uniref:DUF4149 domain-containing protein n=1 Tax=Variovorax jilinensis TaxID=3053513 RepID=UPI002574F7BB|nr:DUF4149 domain-containing protein [Variovorax sp. J22P168]MDM0013157.1 DUF4149 domain-containing protein [Variovorax sp. J22P168]